MGTRVVTTYLVIEYLEVQIYELTKLKYGLNFHKIFPRQLKTLLGCHILWIHTFDQLNEFKTLINSINGIQSSPTSISGNSNYKKRQTWKLAFTTNQQNLNNTYSSPSTIMINIPFNLLRRICTIISNYEM